MYFDTDTTLHLSVCLSVAVHMNFNNFPAQSVFLISWIRYIRAHCSGHTGLQVTPLHEALLKSVSGKWAWRTLWGRGQRAHCSVPSSTADLSSRAGQWHHRAGIAAGSCAWGWSLPAHGHDVASGGWKICVNTPYDSTRADSAHLIMNFPVLKLWNVS